jgi:hypothetical protein
MSLILVTVKLLIGEKQVGYTAEIYLGVRKVWDTDNLPLEHDYSGKLFC